MYKINYLLIPILLMLIAACSSSPETEVPEEIAELENLIVIPASAESTQTINFRQDAVYGDTEDVMLGSIGSVVVDQAGRVFMADDDQNYIHAYEPDGNYLQQVGSEGEGPGEFGNIGILKTDEQHLYAYDWNQHRVNVFFLESLDFSHSIPMLQEVNDIEKLSGRSPWRYYVRSDRKLLVSFNQSVDRDGKILYYLIDQDGKITEEQIFEQETRDILTDHSGDAVITIYFDFGRQSLFSLADDDKIYSAWTEDFLVKVHNSDGSYERAIYYPYPKSELDKNEVLKNYEGDVQRRMIRNADTPSTWPALNSLMVDDQNRMWISTIIDDQDVYDWWVISEKGELQAQFTWSRNRSLLEVKNGGVYTEEVDEVTGLEQIIKYSLELE